MCDLTGARLQVAVPPVQYERRIERDWLWWRLMAQWLWLLQPDTLSSSPLADIVSHASLLSLQPGCLPYINMHLYTY